MKRLLFSLLFLFLLSKHAYTQCNMVTNLVGTTPTRCHGASDGGVNISVFNAASPVQYFANGVGNPFSNGGISNVFPAGNNFVVVVDALGCRDTVHFVITQPAAINVQTSTINVTCNGTNDGSANATASGGAGAPFSFQWQGCTGGTVISGANAPNLFAGCYRVTVTDANGCTNTSQVTINQPPAFQFQTQQDSVRCFGGSDGSATIIVSGAQPPYTYLWANGSTNSTSTGLNANFHSVTVTDVTGCQRTTFVQVLQPARVGVDSIPTVALKCFKDKNGSATVYPRGGTKPYSFLWTGGQTTQTAVNLEGGIIYSVTVTDAKGCTFVGSTVVPEPPAIQVVVNNIADENCAGACDGTARVNVAGGTTPYQIDWGSPNVPLNTTQPTNLCPQLYTITVTDGKGCTNTATATIAAAQAIDLQMVKKDPTCAGLSDGNLNLSVFGGGSPYQYIWNTGATTQDLNNMPCGTYSVVVRDQKNCTATQTYELACPPPIVINFSNVQNVRCFGQNTGSLTVQASGGTGNLTFRWNDPNQQTNATAANLAANTYIVTVTDANGCTNTAANTIGQPNALLANITPADVVCFGGNNGSATANPTGGTPPYQFNWSNGMTGQTIQNLTAGSYQLSVTDANGCTFNQANTQVNQPGSPVQLTVFQRDTACFGVDGGTAQATAVGGNGAPFNFNWSNGNNTPQPSGLAIGNYTITAADSKGCTATASLNIAQFSQIIANIATTAPSCFGVNDGTAVINMVSGGAGNSNPNAYQYNWNVPNPPNATSITNLAGGTTYFLTISDKIGCTANFSVPIEQPEPITVVAQVQSTTCFGASDGSAVVTQVTGTSPATAFAWSNGATTDRIQNVAAGTYFVTVTNSKGCTGVTAIEVLQPDELKISNYEITTLKCTGANDGSIQPIVVGGNAPYTFRWSDGSTTPRISNLAPGRYAVTITDSNGCQTNGEAEILQPSPLQLSTDITDIECAGQKNGRIKIKVDGGAGPYTFSRDGVKFQTSNTFYNLPAGNYSFLVKDKNECISTVTATVIEPLPINVSLPADTTILLGDSLLIVPAIENGAGLLSYEWRSGYVEKWLCVDSLNCSVIQVKPTLSNIYRVRVTDENGCSQLAEIAVKVEKPRGVFVPTAFTPNGDNSNDLLNVFGKSKTIREVLIFRVFDRWGELVFEDANFKVNDPARGWDGTFKSQPCLTGQYSWMVEVEYLDGYREIERGSTLLMR